MTILKLVLAATLLAASMNAQDLKALERQADAEFTRHDCPAAEKSYNEALRLALAAGDTKRTGAYRMRIANCRVRLGDFAAALDQYRSVTQLAEATADVELLREGIQSTAQTLSKMGRPEEAVPMVERVYELALKCGHPAHVARALWMMSGVYLQQGRIRDQIQMLNKAIEVSRSTNDVVMTAAFLETLAIAYISLGDLETAADMESRVLQIPVSALSGMGSTYSRAGNYNNLAEIYLKQGKRAEARRFYEKAVAESTAPDAWRVHLTALLNLSGVLNAAHEYAEADADFHTALKGFEAIKFTELQCSAWKMRSDDLLIRGDVNGAVEAGEQALVFARQLRTPSRVYNALFALGAARSAAGDAAAARGLFDEALGIAENVRAQSPGEVADLNSSYATMVPLYQASVQNLLDLHLPAEAFRRAEESKARVLMDLLRRGGVNEQGAMSPEELAQQKDLRKRMAMPGAPPGVMLEYRQFRRALYDRHPELAAHSGDFEAADLKRLAALLPGSKTALLDYFLVPSGVALFVIREGRIAAYILPDPKHTLAAETRAFREQLARRDLTYKTAAQHLFQRLIAQALPDLAGTTDWIVSPDGALWELPFEALVDAAGKHVIETRSVTLEPSLTAALEIRQRRATKADATGPHLLALGNPLPSKTPLPDAALEVSAIGARYPKNSSLVLTGTAATSAQFRENAPRASVIHLAAHAGLNDADPLASFVRLGSGQTEGEDGSITALDILSLHLHADMVVLSACETGLGSVRPGEGMIGMGWAFAAAGASSTVLSLWKVDSAAAREFMTSFYRNLEGGHELSRAAALRQAGLEMLRMPAYRHPFYWAAFTLQGDGAASAPPTTPAPPR